MWRWIVVLIAIVAVWVDIPKSWSQFPFGYPGVSVHVGPIQYEQEIKTHLGLDLRGGTQLVLELKPPAGTTETMDQLNERSRDVIDNRINELGVSEPVIQALGANRIIVELPGISDIEQAKRLVTETAFLEFKVPNEETPDTEDFKSLDPPLTGDDLKADQIYVAFQGGAGTEPVVHFEFEEAAGKRWMELTKQFLRKRVQITLDGEEISSPVIRDEFTQPSGVIEGGFTPETARELVLKLKSGSFPVPLEVVQSARIDPTLGADSVQRSLIAGAVGLILVAGFMLFYYRLPGLLAILALLYYTALTYALFRLVPVTLTLAGIAGFILSIGMAVDANILTFERLKEELRTGKSLRAAVDAGASRAFPSIFFSNAATILTAGILFWLGTGTVKGFAFTLAIGVAVSFFTAVTVTQMLLRGTIRFTPFRRRWLYGVEEPAAKIERIERAEPRPV